MKKAILLILILLISGCGKVSREDRIKSCQECGFENVTDTNVCCWGYNDCTTQIECDNDNYIHAFYTNDYNTIVDKWGRTSWEYAGERLVTKCEPLRC